MSSPRIGVKALVVRDGHVLMNEVRTARGEVLFGPPGGGQEHGESQAEALVRECREEIGAGIEVFQGACVYEGRRGRRRRGHPAVPPGQRRLLVRALRGGGAGPGPRAGPGAGGLGVAADRPAPRVRRAPPRAGALAAGRSQQPARRHRPHRPLSRDGGGTGRSDTAGHALAR